MPRRGNHNRTLQCTQDELILLAADLLRVRSPVDQDDIENTLIEGDVVDVLQYLPPGFVDLLILDPPYNLTKDYNGLCFRKTDASKYLEWFRNIVLRLVPTLKDCATIYVCSDWKTSALIFPVLEECFCVRNRITWERGKGRGAKMNWKNNAEDIWFCTVSDRFHFDVESVKLKRRVLAPYKVDGTPKDWAAEADGRFRLTHPSNIWTDITVPFWSMPENTDHPTQKPEKLIAKLVLASSRQGDFIFDPFVGSGTTAVVAHKLRRKWCGVDVNHEYLCWALKRINAAEESRTIQGYCDGVFWERNSQPRRRSRGDDQASLFR